jgi:hypothetical protein
MILVLIEWLFYGFQVIKERGESIEIVTDSINIRVTEAVFPARKTRYI